MTLGIFKYHRHSSRNTLCQLRLTMSLIGPKKKYKEKSTPSEEAIKNQYDDDELSKKSENDYNITNVMQMNDTSKIVILNGGDFQDVEKSWLWAQTMRTQHPKAEEIHTKRMTESACSDLDILVLRNVLQLELARQCYTYIRIYVYTYIRIYLYTYLPIYISTYLLYTHFHYKQSVTRVHPLKK